MRRAAVIAIGIGSLSMGVQFALDGRWGMVVACLVAGALWLFPSQVGVERRSTICFLFFAGAGAAGVFLDYTHVWLLTYFVILLIAWDLDHFTRVLQPFEGNHRGKDATALFLTHCKRLGVVAGLGWCFGVVALYLEVSTTFTGVLVLGLILFFSLREGVRYLRQAGASSAE